MNKLSYRACLLAGAIGDALGAAVEFKSDAEIDRLFGAEGVREYRPAYGRLGAITDDTQMLLFTAEGLIRGHVRGGHRGFADRTGVVANAYLRWLSTQGHQNPAQVGQPGWLIGHEDLHHQRAPGNTCLTALKQMTKLGEKAQNQSKGCGTVMRIAPVGLYMARLITQSPSSAYEMGKELSWLTHAHPSGYIAGGALAAIIWGLARGKTMNRSIDEALELVESDSDSAECSKAIIRARALVTTHIPPKEAVKQLGEGWVAEEALAISIYAALKMPNIMDAISLAVSHGGDSDSTGSITGNLVGLLHGAAGFPNHLLVDLELREVITQVAEDLYDFPEKINHPHFFERYPGN
ncbi:ADP-ribosylglycohydrolase family protein [Microvenator marinus]|nr:ADP-ribosylglycohydrolase family protein [Microvenator marinus]